MCQPPSGVKLGSPWPQLDGFALIEGHPAILTCLLRLRLKRMTAMSPLEFDDPSTFSLFKYCIDLMNIGVGQHIHAHYLVGCRF